MNTGEAEGGSKMLTEMSWGMQESGVGAVHWGARASVGNTGKAPSAATDKAGAQSRQGARPVQSGKKGGRR